MSSRRSTFSSSFFWPSFTDLMISLFFVMLVLCVLTFVRLRIEQQATEAQLNRIKEIQSGVQALPKEYFTFQPEFKRFTLNREIQFQIGKSEIVDEYKDFLLKVGRSIEELISRLKEQYRNDDIKYMIVIEGMASKDGYPLNDELSYQRSLALARLWQTNNIVFDPNVCELQIAGSGVSGVGRYSGDQEYKNQRFLIQILPKIGDIDTK
ncbi:MAG: hypothetical protein HS105_05460 [Chloracidobacterium sp.]|nr:hypothetical protein [Chloracidobacterium sp.]